MRHSILVYNDETTSTGSLIPSLRSSFPEDTFDVLPIMAEDIRSGILQKKEARVFVMPGITGDICRYPEQLNHQDLLRIHDFLGRDNVMLTFCASTYFVSRLTIYDAPWSTLRTRESLAPLFNGIAQGPLHAYARPKEPEKWLSRNSVIPVVFKDTDDTWIPVRICYGNGPALFADDPLDPRLEVIARYEDIQGQPAALIKQSTGGGNLYLSCIHPEIFYQEIGPGENLDMARKIMTELKPHEEGRKKFWNSLTTRIRQDLKL